MSVAAGIRFRYVVSQLTQQEIQSFINFLDHELIIKALFYYAMHELADKSEVDPADDVTQMVSNIIQSREPEKEETDDTACKALEDLPHRLIGNVASYLVEERYELFSQSNRAIYLGCNSPNLLQDLHVLSESRAIKDKITRTPRYPFANHVTLYLSEISIERAEALLRTLCKMNRVRSLTVSMAATYQSICALDYIAGKVRGELFSEQIEFFEVCLNERDFQWRTHPYWFSPVRFVYDLLRFCNIKYLSLKIRESRIRHEEEYDQEYLNDIKSTFTNLWGLTLRGMDDIGATILRTNHKSLRYLDIELWQDQDFTLFNSLTFPMLIELEVYTWNLTSMISFVDDASSKKLEQISLDVWCGGYDEELSDPESMQIVLKKMATTYVKLKYLKVTINFEFDDDYDRNDWIEVERKPMTASIFSGIQQGLIQTKDLFRNTFKIWIKIALINKKERKDCIKCLDELMKTLVCCNIGDFMVILEIHGTADDNEMKEHKDYHNYSQMIPAIRLEELQSIHSVSDKIDIRSHTSSMHPTFVIMNKECKMNGYGDRWVMSRHSISVSNLLALY